MAVDKVSGHRYKLSGRTQSCLCLVPKKLHQTLIDRFDFEGICAFFLVWRAAEILFRHFWFQQSRKTMEKQGSQYASLLCTSQIDREFSGTFDNHIRYGLALFYFCDILVPCPPASIIWKSPISQIPCQLFSKPVTQTTLELGSSSWNGPEWICYHYRKGKPDGINIQLGLCQKFFASQTKARSHVHVMPKWTMFSLFFHSWNLSLAFAKVKYGNGSIVNARRHL